VRVDQQEWPPLSLLEAANRLNVTTRVARNALRRGELDGFKIGRFWRIRRESVDNLLHGGARAASEGRNKRRRPIERPRMVVPKASKGNRRASR
jgi:excisionase family DNA binding protein